MQSCDGYQHCERVLFGKSSYITSVLTVHTAYVSLSLALSLSHTHTHTHTHTQTDTVTSSVTSWNEFKWW